MVKFGRHQKFFVEHEQPDSYLVPYNDAKTNIEEDFITAEDFESQWRVYLTRARDEFDASLQHLWRRVFATLQEYDLEEGRGAPPEKALLLFTTHASTEQVQEVLDEFKRIHAMALMNAEALRKLVKKFDKNFHKQKLAGEDENNNGGSGCVDHGGDNPTTTTTTCVTQQQQQQQQRAENGAQELTENAPSVSLSCKLLPQLYAQNFVIGLSALQQGTDLLRSELGLGEFATTAEQRDDARVPAHKPEAEPTARRFPGQPQQPMHGDKTNWAKNQDTAVSSNINGMNQMTKDPPVKDPSQELEQQEEDATFTMLSTKDRKDSHAEHTELVDRRRQELLWLRHSVQCIAQLNLLHHLVAHRGFHSPKDRSDRRPLENSLQAYENAWSSGIHLCECDIALTKDERLILAHDEDFSRLALDTTCEKTRRKVSDLTFQEIVCMALSSGTRPPLLLDVLQSANTIGGQSQLIIEIKPGNREAASALARLFAQNPHLMQNCAVVMSFDGFAMHSLQEEMDALMGPAADNCAGASFGRSLSHSHRRCYSMGIFPSPASLANIYAPDSNLDHHGQQQQSSSKSKAYARPKLLVLTVCDTPKRDVELQVSVTEDDCYEKIRQWTKGRLDGVYMQFEPQMLTPEGTHVLNMLARRFHVGVWGHNGRDPDDYDTFRKLVQEGNVSFVNTDLPRDFFPNGSPLPVVLSSQESSVASSTEEAFGLQESSVASSMEEAFGMEL